MTVMWGTGPECEGGSGRRGEWECECVCVCVGMYWMTYTVYEYSWHDGVQFVGPDTRPEWHTDTAEWEWAQAARETVVGVGH